MTARRIWCRFVVLPLVTAVLGFSATRLPADEPEKPDEKPAAEKSTDRFVVPEGDVARLVKFIEDLRSNHPAPPMKRPTTEAEKKAYREFLQYMMKAPAAMAAAAEKIVALEKDKSSEAYKLASGILLQRRAATIRSAGPEEQKEILKELVDHLAAKKPEPTDVNLVMTVARGLEYGGSAKLAAEAYRSFGEILAKSDDEQIAELAKTLQGAARRLDLPGNKLETLTGKTLDGKEFDWKSYRGKVVLVDFWASWCGPCRAELPNVKNMYKLYHDRGFDVVGINLDRSRDALDKFLDGTELPWTTLHHVGGRHPMAVYYGVMAIPTVILVDAEGKVVSLRARGKTLQTLLADMLGPAEQQGSDSAGGEKKEKDL